MVTLLAMHIADPARAVEPAIVQSLLIASLTIALYFYLQPRCGRKATIAALLIGELISFVPPVLAMFAGLGQYGDICRGFGANYSDWVLILADHFQLFGFAIYSFICLSMSALILRVLKAGNCQGEHDGKAGPPPVDTTPHDVVD